jgi:hypothetical protein
MTIPVSATGRASAMPSLLQLLVPIMVAFLLLAGVPLPVQAFLATDHHHRSSLQHFKQPQQQQQQQLLQHQPQHHHVAALPCTAASPTMVLMGHRNTARTDVQNLLTQRAIQAFIDLLHNCRDGATVRWLEQTYEFSNLEMYHGTAGLNLQKYGEWDDILFDMIQRPSDTVVISAKRRGRGHGGWSKNNPFLEEVRMIYIPQQHGHLLVFFAAD